MTKKKTKKRVDSVEKQLKDFNKKSTLLKTVSKPKVKKKPKKKVEARSSPKVLIFDIETAPIIAHVWSLWEKEVRIFFS